MGRASVQTSRPAARCTQAFRSAAVLVLTTAFGASALDAQTRDPEVRRYATPWTPEDAAAVSDLAASVARSAASVAALSTSTWTSIGPAPLKASINSPVVLGGRITGIAAHPFSAGTIYIAAAGGGVWVTADAGSSWTPLTDSQ